VGLRKRNDRGVHFARNRAMPPRKFYAEIHRPKPFHSAADLVFLQAA
jgi:hypothetical protein